MTYLLIYFLALVLILGLNIVIFYHLFKYRVAGDSIPAAVMIYATVVVIALAATFILLDWGAL
ncbi:hypothetical protein HY373_02250 [Candidatus Berkelbacteria bacterium]|nr:hypothetical protein [Candidatus Berkelbacteria bacterium]MBI4029980.1 hypothetical protein [Candidatus Berkelbacteria bacterium]